MGRNWLEAHDGTFCRNMAGLLANDFDADPRPSLMQAASQ
jgi:hypothetical protein